MANEEYKAYVGNLAFDTIETDIELLLRHIELDDATIKKCDIHLCHDRETGRFKGFAYVSFPEEGMLMNAIQKLNGADYGGRILKVNRATPRERNQGGRGGGRGGRGAGGGGGGGGRGGFRRDGNEGGYRRDFNDGGHRGGGGGGGGGYRRDHGGHRKSQSDDHDHVRKTSESEGQSAPAAERPRLNLKPRTTDQAALAAKQAQEEAETAARQAKLFQ